MEPTTITIAVDAQGHLEMQVQGTNNKALIVGFLELAKSVMLSSPRPEPPSLLVAKGSLPGNGRG